MFIFMMVLCALMVIILVVQFNLYSRSIHKGPSANTSPPEEYDSPLQTLCATEMQG